MNTKITTPHNFRDNTIIVLDSLDRDLTKYPNPSNYVIKMPSVLRNAETIELMSLQLTRTETNVNAGNNKLTVILGGNTYNIVIAIGEYATGTALAAALELALNIVPGSIHATYDTTTMKLQLAIVTQVQYSIIITENCAKLLGIAGTGIRGAGTIVSSATGVINATGMVDLNGTPYLIVSINDYGRILSASNEANKNFLIVPMERYTVGQRFIIAGDEKEKKGIYILSNNQQNIFEMRVSFKRPDGSLYDFAGTDHIMTFRIYRHDYHDMNS